MCKRTLILTKYMLLVITLGFSLISCSEYDNYRMANDGVNHLPVRQYENDHADNNRQYSNDTPAGNELEARPSAVNQQNIPDNLVVVTNANGEQQKPFLERYEELLKQLMKNEKEINLYKQKQKEDKKTVNELKADIGTIMIQLEMEKKKGQGLQEENTKLTNQFAEQRNNLELQMEKQKEEIEKLKVGLVEAQISEIKTKQELVRVKTQYYMDKKRWEAED